MSTLQHINSVIDYNWPEYRRRFPAFDRPEIVPAETLRGMAPAYMRRNIDQDPSSFYMFVRANPLNGDCSRDRFKEFVDDLFYEKLEMGSSYEREGYTRDEAVDKEVLPAARDSEYQRFYDEQMAAAERARASEERNARAEKLGFDPDDLDIIDIDDQGNVAGGRAQTTAVGQAQTTAVDLPKQIWYAVDFHCPAGGMLGYDGNAGRLDGRRGPRGYLREFESPVSDILAVFKDLPEGLKKDMEQIALGDGVVVVKHKGGKFTMVENGKAVMERVSAEELKKSDKLGQKQVTVVTKDEVGKMLSECDSDPEKMMREFVEANENGEIEEDDMLKNRPHNLHRADEGEKVAASVKKAAEGLYEKDGDELNESFVKFATGLIEG